MKKKVYRSLKIHVYMLHQLKPLLGTKLGFSLARSTCLLAHASLWPERSVATT